MAISTVYTYSISGFFLTTPMVSTVRTVTIGLYLMFMMNNCFLLCVSGLAIACIICCRVNVTLDMILGVKDILIS